MYMLTGDLLVFSGRCSSFMAAKDMDSLCLDIQYGLPALGPGGCKKNGQRESSGILR